MNNVDKIIALLQKGVSISQALKEVCGNQRIVIPFYEADFDVSIEELYLSTRSYNALKRQKLYTLNDVVQHFSENGWNSIKNFGKTSAAELFGKIIDVAWNNMNTAKKAEFLASIEENFE